MDNRTKQNCTDSVDLIYCMNVWNNSIVEDVEVTSQIIVILQSVIASVGIVANSTVIIVFLNNEKMRRKIPNIFIINQVKVNSDDLIAALHFYELQGTINPIPSHSSNLLFVVHLHSPTAPVTKLYLLRTFSFLSVEPILRGNHLRFP